MRGEVIDKNLTTAVIECAGVGHLVHATPRTLATLSRGAEAFLLTTLVVREDSMTLYGFATSDERRMFDVLQSVSKLGPRMAMSILEVLDPSEIATAVAREDAKTLARANGVGVRMANRMVVELAEKVDEFAVAPSPAADIADVTNLAAPAADIDQVVEALVGLGFNASEAESAATQAAGANSQADTSTVLRAALKVLGRS
nr:Holliday junction branch migration protein RuvA [Corynebacterium sp. TAE3-ERU12]